MCGLPESTGVVGFEKSDRSEASSGVDRVSSETTIE